MARAPYTEIKTPEGRRIYKAALEQSGRIQLEMEKHESDSKEYKHLYKKDVRTVNEGLAKALALNPTKKPVKKKQISLSLKRKRTSLSSSSSWKKRI